uniref:Apple domain-containing protein n=1 Tax=Ascaris lumbricoides TaxID=6252 RepID=A0A9J2PSR6_ASCLU
MLHYVTITIVDDLIERRTTVDETWSVLLPQNTFTVSPVEDDSKDNFGENYRLVNRTYFAEGRATSESEVEHELQPIKLGKMFARRNDTTVESGLHQNISMHTQGSDVATTMVTQGSPTSVVAIENFIKNDEGTTSAVQDANNKSTTTSAESVSGTFVVDEDENFGEMPFLATLNTFDYSPDEWELQSGAGGSTMPSVMDVQRAANDSSMFSESAPKIQPTLAMDATISDISSTHRSAPIDAILGNGNLTLTNAGTVDSTLVVFKKDQAGSTTSDTTSISPLEHSSPNPWEMHRTASLSAALKSRMNAVTSATHIGNNHFDMITLAGEGGADQLSASDARTTPSAYEGLEGRLAFATRNMVAASDNSTQNDALWAETKPIEPYSVITSQRKPLTSFSDRNNAVNYQETDLAEHYDDDNSAEAHAEMIPYSEDGSISSVAYESWKPSRKSFYATNYGIAVALNTKHTSIGEKQHAAVDGHQNHKSGHAHFHGRYAGAKQTERQTQATRSQASTTMGISLPKYSYPLYYPPKQRGINIVRSEESPHFGFERFVVNGRVVERQRHLDGGKAITVELWNPELHGVDLIAHPGSRIDGSLRPLQKDVINIGQGRNNVERMRLKQLMEKVNGRKHAAGVRSQTSLLPSSYSAEQDAEPVVSKEINVGSVKACCGYETDVYTAEEYDSQPSESTEDELFSSDGFHSSSDTEHEVPGNSILNVHAARRNSFELSQRYVDECFVVKKDRFLTGVSPFERRVVKSQTQCAQFCLSLDYCVSALYSSISTCDAFNTKSGDGQAQLLKLSGYIYLEPKPGKSSSCLIDAARRSSKLYGLSLAYNRAMPPLSRLNKETVDIYRTLIDDDNSFPADPPSTHFKVLKKVHFEDRCQRGETMIIQKSVGWRLIRRTGREMEFTSAEEDCVFACSINLAKDLVPFECSSAVYDVTSRICTLSVLSAGQDRNDDLISDKRAVYFEKMCLTDSLAALCERKRIERQPQHILLRHMSTAVTVSSLSACIQRCLSWRNEGDNFQCRSVMYFHEEEVENCVLNRRTRKERPGDFIEELVSPVDYIDMGECLSRSTTSLKSVNKRLNSSTGGDDDFRPRELI